MAQTQIDAGFISDPDRVEAEMQEAFEDLVSITKELLGGNSENPGTAGATILATDAFALVADYVAYAVDSQGQSGNDDLKNITGAPRDGMRISVRPFDGTRNITVKHAAGGTGQIYTKLGRDRTLRNVRENLELEWKESATAWYEVDADESFRVDQLAGARDLSVLTVSGNSITPNRAVHSVTTSGTAQNINTIAQTSIVEDGREITLIGDDPTTAGHVCTLVHGAGGTGELMLRDSANFKLDQLNKSIRLRKSGTKWYEISRTGGIAPGLAAGTMVVSDGLGNLIPVAGTPSDGMSPTYDSATSPGLVKWAAGAGGGGALVNGCRLSASSTLSNPSTDVTGAASVYLLPHKHDKISLYSGSGSVWNDRVITSLSLSLSGFGVARLVDVYAWDDAGTPKLEGTAWDSGGQVSYTISSLTAANPCVITTTATHAISVGDIVTITQGTSTGTAWTDADLKLTNKFFYVSAVTGTTLTLEGVDTTGLTRTAYTNAKIYKIPASRTTGQTRQNGVKCKTGALTRRFLGTIYIDGSGNLNDAVSQRFCRNVDNKELAAFGSEDTTASFTPAAVNVFYPRTNSTQVGKTRCEMVVAEDEIIDINFVDTFGWTTYLYGMFSIIGINRMLAATFSTWQGVLEFPVTVYTSGASYSTAMISSQSNSGGRAFAPGLFFLQHMQWGYNVNSLYGRSYTTSPAQAAIKAMIWR